LGAEEQKIEIPGRGTLEKWLTPAAIILAAVILVVGTSKQFTVLGGSVVVYNRLTGTAYKCQIMYVPQLQCP